MNTNLEEAHLDNADSYVFNIRCIALVFLLFIIIVSYLLIVGLFSKNFMPVYNLLPGYEIYVKIMCLSAATIISLSPFIKYKNQAGESRYNIYMTYKHKIYARLLGFVLGILCYLISNDYSYFLAIGFVSTLFMLFDFPRKKFFKRANL